MEEREKEERREKEREKEAEEEEEEERWKGGLVGVGAVVGKRVQGTEYLQSSGQDCVSPGTCYPGLL